ncbi:hypothetical protein EYW49_10190 [Siculibacillus lacustris]|uniref:DUF2125 domain-containing protein n=1 Tax=Siculibacillus lacustris TaxID=1549641 RepID=A0A4V2KTN1_9HYPH|nr:hypothetical protein [Siculibacillus lacustris]TBW37975.1 hypothetical protein EYW49_10190 [Siculibacillus lacustris]
MTASRLSRRRSGARRRAVSVLGALGLGLAAAMPADAIEATAAGAAAIRAEIEAYLGRAAPGAPAIVTVAPQGESYLVDVDGDALAAPLKSFGIDLRLGHLRSTQTHGADGSIRATYDAVGPFALAVADQTMQMRFEGIRSESVADPTRGTSTTTAEVATSTTTSVQQKPGEPQRVEVVKTDSGLSLRAEGRPAANGVGSDVVSNQTVAKLTETFHITGAAGAGVPEITITVGLDDVRTDVAIDGFRIEPLLALWRHLVAHHDHDDFTVGQGALKTRLQALLPLFERMRQTVAAKTLSIETPFGFGNAKALGASADVRGLARDGRFDWRMTVDGLEVHSIVVPGWIGRLIPTDLAIGAVVTGYDLATPLSVFLDSADFAAAKPVDDATAAQITALFLPGGKAEIDLSGIRLRSSLYAVEVDGRLAAGKGGVTGYVTVRATGLDAVERLVSDPKTGPQGQTVLQGLTIAQSFADRREGASVWRFDIDGASVAVNGRLLTPPTGGGATPATPGSGKPGTL